MALQGDVGTVPLRDLLGWLAARRASGTLSLSRGMIARRFQLRGGRVMLSSSTEEEMLLGRLLVARGLIDLSQLATALEGRAGSRPRLGKALTRAGLVSTPQLRSVLTEKVRRLLVDALTWTDGGFFFDDSKRRRDRPAVAAAVRITEVLSLPANHYGDRGDTDDVVVADEDIIEIVELTQRGRARVARGTRKRLALPVSAAKTSTPLVPEPRT